MRLLVGSSQVLLAALLSMPSCGQRDRAKSPPAAAFSAPVAWGPAMQQPAPLFAGQDTEGQPFQLSDYRGKVVVLSFWGFF